MPEPPTNPEPVVYQVRVVLRGVSPLIWRRLLVRSDSTIADLHATLQRALGWSDEHLNRFRGPSGERALRVGAGGRGSHRFAGGAHDRRAPVGIRDLDQKGDRSSD